VGGTSSLVVRSAKERGFRGAKGDWVKGDDGQSERNSSQLRVQRKKPEKRWAGAGDWPAGFRMVLCQADGRATRSQSRRRFPGAANMGAGTYGKPQGQNPPRLGDGLYFRDLPESVIRNRAALEKVLTQWIAGYVSAGRAKGLVENAVGIDDIIRFVEFAPSSMNLDRKRRVHVHFIFGHSAEGGWWVKAVGFYMVASDREISHAEKERLRQRLEEKAEERAIRAMPPLSRIFLDPKFGSGNLNKDLQRGRAIMARMIDHIYPKAKKVAALMKNPIGPDMSDPASILGELSKAVGGVASNLSNARNGVKTAFEVTDWSSKVREYGVAISSDKKHEREGAGLKMAGDGLDLAFGSTNPVGMLASTILGSFIEIGIVNQAGEIARKRGLIYLFFVNGVVNGLIGQTSLKPQTPSQKQWFVIGEAFVRPLSEQDCFSLHLALVEYTSNHNMSSWGLSVPRTRLNDFADYLRLWSPGLIERSMLWQLGKKKYLVD
jgi:hypothetical protein